MGQIIVMKDGFDHILIPRLVILIDKIVDTKMGVLRGLINYWFEKGL